MATLDRNSPWSLGWKARDDKEIQTISRCEFPDHCCLHDQPHPPEECHVHDYATLYRQLGLEGH